MAGENRVLKMYGDFCRFLRDAESNEFYSFFQKSVQNSTATVSVFEKYVERRIDLRWLEAIENAIVPIDNILRNPNSFIKREEDIIPIAQAHGIGPESIRHLAQHTNMIASVEGDRVTPNRILNITKDDSLETYENRFIYTLLKNAAYFLDKRMSVLMKDTKVADLFEYQIEGNGVVGSDRINYNFNMHMESPHEEIDDDQQLINADISTMNPLQRIERLRKILYTFQGSAFCRSLTNSTPVRSPLVMTNVLKKNPNFIKAVTLWNFINSYQEVGYTTDYVEQYRTPTAEDKNELFALVMLEYVMMKKQCRKLEDTTLSYEEEQKAEGVGREPEKEAPNIVSRSIDELCGRFNFTVDEIRRIYEKELNKKEKKNEAEFAKARGVFARAIAFEKENDRLSEIRRREQFLEEIRHRLALAEADARRVEEERKPVLAAPEKEKERLSGDYIYRYSFLARIIQAQEPMQTYYTEIKNYLLSFRKTRSVMAWSHENFRYGCHSVVSLTYRNKVICMTIALDPFRVKGSKYHAEESKDSTFPTRCRIYNERGVKCAKNLIDLLMAQLGAEQDEIPNEDYRKPYQTTEEMLEENPPLVRRIGRSPEKGTGAGAKPKDSPGEEQLPQDAGPDAPHGQLPAEPTEGTETEVPEEAKADGKRRRKVGRKEKKKLQKKNGTFEQRRKKTK